MGFQPSGHRQPVTSLEVYKSRGRQRSAFDEATRAGTAPVWQTDGRNKRFMAGRVANA